MKAVEITINHNTQNVMYWQGQLEIVLEPTWFDTIAKYIREAGEQIESIMEKRKACYIRCARSGVTCTLWAERYKRDFKEDMPVKIDGKDWRELLQEGNR